MLFKNGFTLYHTNRTYAHGTQVHEAKYRVFLLALEGSLHSSGPPVDLRRVEDKTTLPTCRTWRHGVPHLHSPGISHKLLDELAGFEVEIYLKYREWLERYVWE